MKRVFVETGPFTARLKKRLSDEAFRELQKLLMANPEAGAVMPGCGGLRKLRFGEAFRGKGKRGGVRVVYLHIPEVRRIDLITIYSKDEKDDLSADEKKRLARLARLVREEAIRHRPKGV
jgi:mRNA-degrading endonuclease RelE of RelBE toxin-antitoxin system